MVPYTPARSHRIIFRAAASGLLRRSRSSSCVSSPMAKYASCSRAHGPQKATPRISTTARRWQGLSVLLRTSHGTNIFASLKETSFLRLDSALSLLLHTSHRLATPTEAQRKGPESRSSKQDPGPKVL